MGIEYLSNNESNLSLTCIYAVTNPCAVYCTAKLMTPNAINIAPQKDLLKNCVSKIAATHAVNNTAHSSNSVLKETR